MAVGCTLSVMLSDILSWRICKECEVDVLDPGIEMLGMEEKAALAKCKREDTESEKENDAMGSAAQSGVIAYTPERSAKKVKVKELTDEEAESESLGLG